MYKPQYHGSSLILAQRWNRLCSNISDTSKMASYRFTLGRTSSSKGQIFLVATASTRQFIPCWSLYVFQVKITLASVPKSTDLIQLSLSVIFEKSSHSFGSGPWIALVEHPSSGVYHSCLNITPRKSPGNIGTIGHGDTTILEAGVLLSFRFLFGGPL
jgi:hypothetical protein